MPKIPVPMIERGFDPIQQKWRDTMQSAFGALADAMPGVGLCLFLFLFDLQAGKPRANYISNTDRKQTLAAIEEWVARQKEPKTNGGKTNG